MDDKIDDIGGSGYTLEQLSAYLDADREPAIAAIDENAECQAVLASLERVGALSRELVAHDAELNPVLDESWLGGLLATITREVKAGRDVPLASHDSHTRLSITEGAIRELVRRAGDSVNGVIVGRCAVVNEDAGTRVELSISVLLGAPVREAAEAVRQRVFSELLRHTELDVTSVDVTVVDVHVISNEGTAS